MTGVTFKIGAVSLSEDGPASFPQNLASLATGPARIFAASGPQESAVPFGVALCTGPVSQGLFEVAILAADGERLGLGPFEEDAVIAEWRKLGASSGLPLMIAHEDGRLDNPFPQIGPLQLGAIRIRRRHGLLNGRRPRFLVRRKTGRLPIRPSVHREREIACGFGA